MSCQTVMLPDPVTVSDTATLSSALETLFRHRIKSVPVVDARHLYRGLFGVHTMVRTLLPRAATLDGASLTDLAFVHDSLDALKERLTRRMNESVMSFVDLELKPLSPEQSIMDTLLLLNRHRHNLPVTDPASGRLLGIVTTWEILSRLTGRSD